MDQQLSSVSIIICFYNAQNRLSETLEHIKRIEIGNYAVELILVNNNSSDQSIETIESIMDGFERFPWRIVDESNQGLLYARLKGIKSNNSDVILFCDDDNWLQKDYILIGMELLNSKFNIAILGGLGKAVSNESFPSWFDENQNFYAVGPQFPNVGIVRGVRNVVYGAGMFLVRSYYQKIIDSGFIQFSSGRKGNLLTSGEDSELCLAIQIAGYQIYYDDLLKFKHFIEEKRLSGDYLQKLKKGMAESRFITRFYLDYLNGITPKLGRAFWLKELIYTLKDLLFEIMQLKMSDVNRKLKFIQFLLLNRANYTKQVGEVVNTCHNLAKISKL